MISESTSFVSSVDWIYREAKDVGSAGAIGVYGEASSLKNLLDETYDGFKEESLAEVLPLRDTLFSVYSEAKSLGSQPCSF